MHIFYCLIYSVQRTAPLIAEYDWHMDQMTEQMENYEVSKTLEFSLIKFEKLKSKKVRLLTGEKVGTF